MIDNRLPKPGELPPTIMLKAPSGHAEHYMAYYRPDSTRLAALLERSRARRKVLGEDEYPEDVVERAFSNGQMKHYSDGPLGGIWYLEKGKEEVVVCLVEELEVLRRKWEGSGKGGWRVLGMGVEGCDGRVYLLHPCGRGGPEEKEVPKKKQAVVKADQGGQKKGGLRGFLKKALS